MMESMLSLFSQKNVPDRKLQENSYKLLEQLVFSFLAFATPKVLTGIMPTKEEIDPYTNPDNWE